MNKMEAIEYIRNTLIQQGWGQHDTPLRNDDQFEFYDSRHYPDLVSLLSPNHRYYINVWSYHGRVYIMPGNAQALLGSKEILLTVSLTDIRPEFIFYSDNIEEEIDKCIVEEHL